MVGLVDSFRGFAQRITITKPFSLESRSHLTVRSAFMFWWPGTVHTNTYVPAAKLMVPKSTSPFFIHLQFERTNFGVAVYDNEVVSYGVFIDVSNLDITRGGLVRFGVKPEARYSAHF